MSVVGTAAVVVVFVMAVTVVMGHGEWFRWCCGVSKDVVIEKDGGCVVKFKVDGKPRRALRAGNRDLLVRVQS